MPRPALCRRNRRVWAVVKRIENQSVLLEDIFDAETYDFIAYYKAMPAGDWSEFLQPDDEIEFTASAEAATPWRLERPRDVKIMHRPAWKMPVRRDHALTRTWDRSTQDATAIALRRLVAPT